MKIATARYHILLNTHHTMFNWSWKGIAAATALVAVTTADDAVWLLKFTSPSLPTATRITHGALFIATLTALSAGCVVAALLVEKAVIAGGCSTPENEEVVMGIVGASLCWFLAGYLYVKKLLKRRKKRAMQASAVSTDNGAAYGSIEQGSRSIVKNLGAEFDDDASSSSSSSSDSSFDGDDIPQVPSVMAVISLTSLGALDEMIYLPSLIIGRVFTSAELCLGSFLAAIVVLVIVVFFLSTFKPLIDFVDRVPLYGIIGMFAIVLTVGVIADVMNG